MLSYYCCVLNLLNHIHSYCIGCIYYNNMSTASSCRHPVTTRTFSWKQASHADRYATAYTQPTNRRHRLLKEYTDALLLYTFFFLYHHFLFPVQLVGGFSLYDLLDKPWSQASSLLPPPGWRIFIPDETKVAYLPLTFVAPIHCDRKPSRQKTKHVVYTSRSNLFRQNQAKDTARVPRTFDATRCTCGHDGMIVSVKRVFYC